jgi:genome maintenance exonuclease 1
MKQFIHTPLQTTLPELECITTPTERFYVTPNGDRYPSITHVLSILSNGIIEKWRERIGQEEAQKISEHACNRGTDLHSVLEAYLKNETLSFPEDPKSRVKIMFNRMKRVLSKVDNIVAQEIPLYSDALRIAGRCDVIADYSGVLSVIDFKGATKAKKKDWIKSYFLQTTAYSLMFQERTGISAEQIVILMSGENDFSCQIFVEQRDKYVQQLKETIDLFTAKAA